MNIEKECIPKEHKELALAARPLVKWIRKNDDIGDRHFCECVQYRNWRADR